MLQHTRLSQRTWQGTYAPPSPQQSSTHQAAFRHAWSQKRAASQPAQTSRSRDGRPQCSHASRTPCVVSVSAGAGARAASCVGEGAGGGATASVSPSAGSIETPDDNLSSSMRLVRTGSSSRWLLICSDRQFNKRGGAANKPAGGLAGPRAVARGLKARAQHQLAGKLAVALRTCALLMIGVIVGYSHGRGGGDCVRGLRVRHTYCALK